MFGRFKPEKSTIFDLDLVTGLFDTPAEALPLALPPSDTSGAAVDPRCNKTITVSCLLQLYNAVGYVPFNDPRNSIGITGYLVRLPEFNTFMSNSQNLYCLKGEFANIQDLQSFYAEQRPDALGSSFTYHSVHGWCTFTCFRFLRKTEYFT
jgi:tripeptidyl-peptidase-1